VERAILWAMRVHPDERPANVEAFRQALIGNRAAVSLTTSPLRKPTLLSILQSYPERALWWGSITLTFLSLLVTLVA
jgi:serine/threonine-protein kinase